MKMSVNRPPYIGAEHRDGKVFAYHTVPRLDFSDKGFYRSGVSVEYYHKREIGLWYKDRKRRTIVLDHDRIINQALSYNVSVTTGSLPYLLDLILLKEAPRFEHKDLWTFYTTVGYDYKKRRYTSDPSLEDYGPSCGPLEEDYLKAVVDVFWSNK